MNVPVAALTFACVVGFAISIPIGPMSTFCIRATVARGQRAGLAAGAGVAFVDALYGALGIIGSTLPDRFLGDHRVAVHVLAALVLGAFGFLMLRAREDSPAIAERGIEQAVVYLSASFRRRGLAPRRRDPGAVPIFARALRGGPGSEPSRRPGMSRLAPCRVSRRMMIWSVAAHAVVVESWAARRLRRSLRIVNIVVAAMLLVTATVSLADDPWLTQGFRRRVAKTARRVNLGGIAQLVEHHAGSVRGQEFESLLALHHGNICEEAGSDIVAAVLMDAHGHFALRRLARARLFISL